MPFPTERESWILLLAIIIGVCLFEFFKQRNEQKKHDEKFQKLSDRLDGK